MQMRDLWMTSLLTCYISVCRTNTVSSFAKAAAIIHNEVDVV